MPRVHVNIPFIVNSAHSSDEKITIFRGLRQRYDAFLSPVDDFGKIVMKAKSWIQLIVLGMIWGSSFLFQRITVPAVGAGMTAMIRVALAALVLALAIAILRRPLQWRENWRAYITIGSINAGLPFLLFAFAAHYLPAGYLAVLNATVPFFTVLVVWASGPRPSASKLIGVVIGILGIATLARFGTVTLTLPTIAAFAAGLFAAVLYAIGARAVRTRFANVDPLVVACGSMTGTLLPLLPVSAISPPMQFPSASVVWSLLVLGVICTGLAYALFYRLIREAGSERAVTVTFIVPIFAQLWGAIFLGEAITWASAAGCGLVLVALALIFEKAPGVKPRVVPPQLCAARQ
jgi:drug/metabolite transporter (DMT)-like permease